MSSSKCSKPTSAFFANLLFESAALPLSASATAAASASAAAAAAAAALDVAPWAAPSNPAPFLALLPRFQNPENPRLVREYASFVVVAAAAAAAFFATGLVSRNVRLLP